MTAGSNRSPRVDSAQEISRLRDQVYSAYTAKTPKSKALHERALKSLAGGVSGNLRYFPPYPLYMTHGAGSKTFDVDGNSYIDCLMGNGPMLLGHRHPDVDASIRLHQDKGSLIFNPDIIVECAELLQELVPCAEQVRFLNSGTEAVFSAVRIARAHTQKSKLIKFFGHYHGQDDQFLIGRGTSPTIISGGVPNDSVANTVMLEFNDIDAVRSKLEQDNEIAAVLLDPSMQTSGVWPADKDYLVELRRLTEKHGVILIFDEVITGFRMGPGGAQRHYGVTPDMAVFAKAFANGEKISAVVGRHGVMDAVIPGDPSSGFAASGEKAFQSGTGNDCTSGVAAAIASMTAYKRLESTGAYGYLNELTRELSDGLVSTFSRHGIRCHVNQWNSLLSMYLSDQEPGYRACQQSDNKILSLFLHGLLGEGVFLIPTSANMFLSFAHTKDDITNILTAAEIVLDKYQFKGVY